MLEHAPPLIVHIEAVAFSDVPAEKRAFERIVGMNVHVTANGLRFSGFVPRANRETKSSRRRHEARCNRRVGRRLWRGNLKIAADLRGGKIVDFVVPWHS